MSSSSITASIIRTINSGLGKAFRNNTVGVFDKKRGVYRSNKDRSAIGTGDVVACIDGKYYEFEVKVGKDRQSDAQKESQRRLELAGGVYHIIKSFDDFLSIATDNGWIKNGIIQRKIA